MAMLGASLAFACMTAFVKLSSDHGVPLPQILFYRAIVSLVLMLGWMQFIDEPFRTPHWRSHLRRGAASLAGMITYFSSITLLPIGAAVTLNYTSPLVLAILLLSRYRERPQPRMLAAMLCGFTGIVLLLQPSYHGSQWLGVTLALASAVTAAIAALNIRSLNRLNEPAARTVAHFSLYVLVGTLPWFLVSDPLRIDLQGALLALGAGAFATVGQLLLMIAHRSSQTLLVSLLGYSQVVFTTLLGMALWGDRPGASAWLAIALITGSGIFAMRLVQGRR